jgi:hypothetical protein
MNPDIVNIEAKYNPVLFTLYFGLVRIQIGTIKPRNISNQKKIVSLEDVKSREAFPVEDSSENLKINSITRTASTPLPSPERILIFNPWLKALALKYAERIIIDKPAAMHDIKK